jgi:hypothetical protein
MAYHQGRISNMEFAQSAIPFLACMGGCCCVAQCIQCRIKRLYELERQQAEFHTDLEMLPVLNEPVTISSLVTPRDAWTPLEFDDSNALDQFNLDTDDADGQ